MKGVIDRFEGEFVIIVFDDGKVESINRQLIPNEAKEGDVIVFESTIYIDNEETLKRKKKSKKYLEFWED
ncbi:MULTISPECIES: DUF3006 domain-containing protein [Caloramator]|uniref:DUF3006 domain-containing protein n=1 Tax=Caloramator australicus RC3 TaxID=857293 RepID=G0V4G1_9CLOT|nr:MULTISPECIES: DUF3006 domain-containing protein [Caloramator]MDO6355807.1 DUF3006 domain-containing protein [Caloramator sp. CAR-1]CCC58001.1 hypothetical protein CAAU_0352 [Caloramator australicus RC3]